MFRSLQLVCLVVGVMVIVLLVMQLQEDSNRGKDVNCRNQDRVTKASRLLIASAGQAHPLLSLEEALEAKFHITELIDTYGSMMHVEQVLKLPSGRIDALRTEILQHLQLVESEINEKVIRLNPSFNVTVNDLAGLKGKKRHRERIKH